MDGCVTFWLLCGLGLIISELLVPGFVIFFFGVGALCTAPVAWLVPALPVAGQCVVFVVASLLTLWLLRKRLISTRGEKRACENPDEELLGASAQVCEAIAPGVPGRVLLRGVTWTAEAEEPLSPGEQVKICARNNITLKVRKL